MSISLCSYANAIKYMILFSPEAQTKHNKLPHLLCVCSSRPHKRPITWRICRTTYSTILCSLTYSVKPVASEPIVTHNETNARLLCVCIDFWGGERKTHALYIFSGRWRGLCTIHTERKSTRGCCQPPPAVFSTFAMCISLFLLKILYALKAF